MGGLRTGTGTNFFGVIPWQRTWGDGWLTQGEAFLKRTELV